MKPPVPPVPGSSEPDGSSSVAALAREIEDLRRQLTRVAGLSDRVDEIVTVIADLTTTVSALESRRAPTPCPSWLLLPADEPTALLVLDELVTWIPAVYLRYHDGFQTLPECWCWHPEIVEELLWLMHAWLAAYQGKAASVALVGDWHDRQRPGVVRRIKQFAGSCSLENHMTREGWDRRPAEAPVLPGVEAVPLIAAWWGPRRADPAPEPGPMTRKYYR